MQKKNDWLILSRNKNGDDEWNGLSIGGVVVGSMFGF